MSGNGNCTEPEQQALLSQLSSASFLVDDSFDEVSWLKAQNRLRRFANSTLSLTIAPTMACNFACTYCFENRHAGRMSDDTADALISFVERRLKRSDALAVTWFGGEPTLCLRQIERFQRAFAESALRYDAVVHPSSIITNGYLLDGEMAKKLVAAGISSAQVTLDGPREVHDRRRKLSNGTGTFDRILSNLDAAARLMKIVIRANLDEGNFDDAHRLIESLESAGLLEHVFVYFAQVNPSGSACADVRGQCLSTERFAKRQVQLYRQLIERGFYRIEYPDLVAGGHCGADSANSFVIDPDGNLFKCWEELGHGPDRSTGTIFNDDMSPGQQMNLARYMGWDQFALPGCVECDILPMCMGGCPIEGLRMSGDRHGYCCSWKFNLQEILELRYLCEHRKEVNT
ncbi:MAG: radical SAM protein [Candidatus Zixiibacteriota bacterium]